MLWSLPEVIAAALTGSLPVQGALMPRGREGEQMSE